MKKTGAIALYLCFTMGAAVTAMDWPLPEAKVVRNFGYNDQGKPILGTVFEGEGEILCAEKGELIFTHDGMETASRLPSPLGAWTAVDHDDGLMSIYGRYKNDGRVRPVSSIDRGAVIAGAGSSGWSRRGGVYFLLYDRRERRWVNASMVITSFPDTVPPQIQGIQLRKTGETAHGRTDNGRPVEGGIVRGLGQGRYTILVNTADTLLNTRETALAPHRIVCSVNGEEAGALSFETICARDGILMVNRNGLIPASQVYAPWPAFEAGDVHLSRGQAILEIIVQDIAGNSRNASARMLIE